MLGRPRRGRPRDEFSSSSIQSHILDEKSKTDYVIDWLFEDPEFKQILRNQLKTMAMEMSR